MPHIVIKISSTKTTTREGDHPDDIAYLEQIKGHFVMKLVEYGFNNSEVDAYFVGDNGLTLAKTA